MAPSAGSKGKRCEDLNFEIFALILLSTNTFVHIVVTDKTSSYPMIHLYAHICLIQTHENGLVGRKIRRAYIICQALPGAFSWNPLMQKALWWLDFRG